LIDPTAMPAFGYEKEANCGPGDDLISLAEQQVDEQWKPKRSHSCAGGKSGAEISEQYHGCERRLI
jgi:hypothetical protein